MLAFFKRLFKTPETRLPRISDVKNLQGKRVLLRASLNVPVKDGKVAEEFRIEQTLPTIKYLQEQGAKVIIIGHIGREPEETLEPVFEVLKEKVGAKWGVPPDSLQNGEVLLLENLRRDLREHSGDDTLAKELAALADIYINDAFSDSHRSHASIVGIPKYLPSYFGFNFVREHQMLKVMLDPVSPSIFLIGGAKFETKLPLILKFAKKYDHVFVGGALANDMFKAKGLEVGRSLVSNIDLSDSEVLTCENLILPSDVVVNGKKTVAADKVGSDEIIYDVGEDTLNTLAPTIDQAATILWNGPLGNYEEGFKEGTERLAQMIAKAPGHSVVGGGDTVASIRQLGLSDDFDFISTAGGAMLVFLETGTLPGLDAVLGR